MSTALILSTAFLDADTHPFAIRQRYQLFYSLLSSYTEQEQWSNLKVIPPNQNHEEKELLIFHDADYINALKTGFPNIAYNLIDDCYPFTGLFKSVSNAAYCSIDAAMLINKKHHNIVINWTGGWHHAKPKNAAGYCFINDIVLAIQSLDFSRILYIDIDIHHSDGIESAFYYNRNIFTLSFHHYSPGFYPGSGNISSIGAGEGLFYNLNIPLRSNLSDSSFIDIFTYSINSVITFFDPLCIVIQCGVDGLSTDPLSIWNLSSFCYSAIMKWLKEKISTLNIPLLVLGGGGYNYIDTAKCWLLLTAILCDQSISIDIPNSNDYYMSFKPSFKLFTPSNSLEIDKNDETYLKILKERTDKFCFLAKEHRKKS